MRYPLVPLPVVLDGTVDRKTDKPAEMSFGKLVLDVLKHHPKVMEDIKSMTMAKAIEAKLPDVRDGEVWKLDDDLHEFLYTLLRTHPFNPEWRLALMTHVMAMASAPYSDPKAVDVPAPAAPAAKAEA